MEAIRLTETASSPIVTLDKETNEFSFTGRSLPADPQEFYTPIFKWFDEYLKNPNKETNIVFEIEYMNTASSKMLLELFRKLKDYIDAGISINVKWIYDEDDEEVLKSGIDFAKFTGIPINLACKE
ncbi:DUF1987 domain-containing protein [Bacteroidota bacterium]